MSNSSQPVLNIYQSYLEVLAQLAAVAFHMTDQFSHAGLMTLHQTLNEQLKLAHALAKPQEPAQEKESVEPALVPGIPGKMMETPAQVLLLATEMQKEFAGYVQRYMEQFKDTARR